MEDLVNRTNMIDKYRTETCCVIGNYYSLRFEQMFTSRQRALKLNPGYLSALTLMGHEYMEMKNTHAAIQSYRQEMSNLILNPTCDCQFKCDLHRQAIEVNRRDYRAWYGLGQTYEILKMPFYCLYYYKQVPSVLVTVIMGSFVKGSRTAAQ